MTTVINKEMCDGSSSCCNQLEAEGILSNEQLLQFDIRSKQINWKDYIVPLQKRISPVYLQQKFPDISKYRTPIGNHNRREVLVCHDMMGNYLGDRFYHSSKKYDDYRFYHWSGIDYFCYFSHKYITIPPCGWLNAAHKHGVRVLGTFITEGVRGEELLQDVLQSKETVDKTVAALTRLCNHFGFEGWLVNVECKVNENAMTNMLYFLEQLRIKVQRQISSGIVFWYDSILISGELQWQNEINKKNLRFFKAADAMLINYAWNDENLNVTREICANGQISWQNVFFGLDVFGRGQVAKFQSKQTLARIVNSRFSTGIFAPGWTYETLSELGYDIKRPLGLDNVNFAFLKRNEKFWWSLWDNLATHIYFKLPFYSDFCLGSGKHFYANGVPIESSSSFFNLSHQSLQPSIALHNLVERCYDDAFNGGSCLRILQSDKTFRLCVTDFGCRRGGLVCAYAYKLHERDGQIDCVLRFCTGSNTRDCYLFLGEYFDKMSLEKGRCYVSPFKPKYNMFLTGALESSRIPKDMAVSEFAANGWNVRYYVIAFDGPVQIKDMGLLYRRTQAAQDHAYLGALFINDFDVNHIVLPHDSNVAFIDVYESDRLN